MKKNFKMAVISLSFLIIGSMLMACGTKKVEEKVTTETSVNNAEEVELFKYKFQIPDSFRFYSYSDNDIIFKNKKEDTTQITISSSTHNDDISNISEEDFKNVAKVLFDSAVIEDEDYFESNNFKTYTCTSKEIESGKTINYIVYQHADRSTVFQIFCFMIDADDEQLKQNKEIMKQIYDNFIQLNY